MIEAKLLNCPFCKEELEVVGKGHYFAHKTNGCILQHLCFEIDDEEAINAWNTRKPMERIIEQLNDKLMTAVDCANIYDNPTYDTIIECYEEAIKIVKEEGGIE